MLSTLCLEDVGSSHQGSKRAGVRMEKGGKELT